MIGNSMQVFIKKCKSMVHIHTSCCDVCDKKIAMFWKFGGMCFSFGGTTDHVKEGNSLHVGARVNVLSNIMSTSDWKSTFLSIKNTHDQAYRAVDEAVKLEEREEPLEALDKYKYGITLIDKALNIRVTCPDDPDETWQQACDMIKKLKRTRGEVLSRINTLKLKHANDLVLPSHGTQNLSTNITPQTYIDLANALYNLQLQISNTTSTIIYTHDNVKMYCINPDGAVTLVSDTQTLTIFSMEGDVPNMFLQVGNWIYPLIPGISPCYRTSYNCFIFPDVHSSVEGASVGIVVPDEEDNIVHELLINILHGVVVQHEQEAPLSEKISYGLIKGAGYLAQGLIWGAEGISNLLHSGTPKLINSIAPASADTTISPTVSSCLKATENATKTTAQVTGYVADKVCIATTKLGQYLAPHIQYQGTQLLKTTMNYSEEEASSKVKNVLDVAAGAVEGFSTVYNGLETSASILGQSLKDNTVKIVQHKYGEPAGDVASDTLNTVGNVYVISRNTNVLTPKGLAKRTAKDTGKAVVKDYQYPGISGSESQRQIESKTNTQI